MMNVPVLKKYGVIEKYRCKVCTTNQYVGHRQEFDDEEDMIAHMLKHCPHSNVVIRHKFEHLDVICADCSCTFGLENLIDRKSKYEVKNPEDLLSYLEALQNLNTEQISLVKVINHILWTQKTIGLFKSKKKFKRMTKSEIQGCGN